MSISRQPVTKAENELYITKKAHTEEIFNNVSFV